MSMVYTLSITDYEGGFPLGIMLNGVDYYRDEEYSTSQEFTVPYTAEGKPDLESLAYAISKFDIEEKADRCLVSIFGWVNQEGVFTPYIQELINECLEAFLDEGELS